MKIPEITLKKPSNIEMYFVRLAIGTIKAKTGLDLSAVGEAIAAADKKALGKALADLAAPFLPSVVGA